MLEKINPENVSHILSPNVSPQISQALMCGCGLVQQIIQSPLMVDMAIGAGIGLVAKAALDYGWHRFLLGEDPYNFDLRMSTRVKAYTSFAVYGAAIGSFVEPIKFLGWSAIQALRNQF